MNSENKIKNLNKKIKNLKRENVEKMETIKILGSEVKAGTKNNHVFNGFVFNDSDYKMLPDAFKATRLATLDVNSKGHVTNLKIKSDAVAEIKKIFTAVVGDSKKSGDEKLDTELVTQKVDALKIKILNAFRTELIEIRDMRNRVRTIELTFMSGKDCIAISTDGKTKTSAGSTDFLGHEIESNGWSRGSYKVDTPDAEILQSIKTQESNKVK